MIYKELLEKTQKRKDELLSGASYYAPCGWYYEDEDAPWSGPEVALAYYFCKLLDENMTEVFDSAADSWEQMDIYNAYAGFNDGEVYIECLPVEARLYD